MEKENNNIINTSNTLLKWDPDPKGYFIIKPVSSQKKVFVRYYDSYNSKHILKYTFTGITTLQIIQSIIERKLISRLNHATYLGKEIEKAIIALKNNLNYVQDKELKFKNEPPRPKAEVSIK